MIISNYGIVSSQSYTSYFTGNSIDSLSIPHGGVCMMGGASENDNAMKWFLEQANGGDVLVLRASGSDGYNNYLYSTLGISVNSVETIVFNNASASYDTYILNKIRKAEAIWFAGGNQWDYVSYWRNTPIDSLINDGITNRNIVIGGTSAGMAILGGVYFSAKNGSVTSSTALNNPYDLHVQVDSSSFIHTPYLQNVITDTHYDNPNRKGRQIAFMARALTDFGIDVKGIACDEYTSICIDTNGIASVYGGFPTYDDNAYFIQINCEKANNLPENCNANMPLNWNQGGEAIKACKLKGTSNGQNTFSMLDWKTNVGGQWNDWYIDNGTLYENTGIQINCSGVGITNITRHADVQVAPNPTSNSIHIYSAQPIIKASLFEINGRIIYDVNPNLPDFIIDMQSFNSGIYLLKIQTFEFVSIRKITLIKD